MNMQYTKKILLGGLSVALASSLASCSSLGGQDQTAGTVLGGVAGGLLGSQIGHGIAGPIIGTLGGAIAGAEIGKYMDRQNRD